MGNRFQRAMVTLHKRLMPRGHSHVVRHLARLFPALQMYQARLKDGDQLYVDLREAMCMGYFFQGELPHERGLEELLKVSLKPGSTFVDVGANVGYYTRKAARLVGHAGRVASFEPSPRAFSLLERNVSDLPQARIYQCAVGASRLKASFWVRDKGDTSSLLPSGDGKELIIEVAPLDEILAGWTNLDMMKIDVEGSELEVLKGAERLIARTGPLVVFEYLSQNTRATRVPFEDYIAFFARFPQWTYKVSALVHDPSEGPEKFKEASDYVAIPVSRQGLRDLSRFTYPIKTDIVDNP